MLEKKNSAGPTARLKKLRFEKLLSGKRAIDVVDKRGLAIKGSTGISDRGELYMVKRSLREELPGSPHLVGSKAFVTRMFATSLNRQGQTFLWDLRLPGPDGREDNWMVSARDAAEKAKTQWVQMYAGAGAYGVGRTCKYRALRALQQAGLLVVDQPSRKNPRVTILECSGK
jgi:hypothetical protein